MPRVLRIHRRSSAGVSAGSIRSCTASASAAASLPTALPTLSSSLSPDVDTIAAHFKACGIRDHDAEQYAQLLNEHVGCDTVEDLADVTAAEWMEIVPKRLHRKKIPEASRHG